MARKVKLSILDYIIITPIMILRKIRCFLDDHKLGKWTTKNGVEWFNRCEWCGEKVRAVR